MFFVSAIWKLKARTALKGRWLTALLIALSVKLPVLLTQAIASATGNSLQDMMANLTIRLESAANRTDIAAVQETLDAGLQQIMAARGAWIMQGVQLLTALMTPFLTLGMIHWLQSLLRGEPAGDVSAVLSRARLFGKAIGLRLYVGLRVFLWMLPGLALNLLSLLPVHLADPRSRMSVLSAANTSLQITSLAAIAAAVLGVMALLKYALGDQILADHPEKGPIQAAKESKAMMRGKRGTLFSLYLGFLLWYFLEMMAVNLAGALFGAVIGTMVGMLCSLALNVYLRASVTAFYLDCLPAEAGRQPEGPREAEEEEIEL